MLYDIIIIGGGMVGASLACALRDAPLRIAIVDAMPPNVTEDHRLIALTDKSHGLLQQIGIWPLLVAHAAPIQQVHVSRRGQFGTTRLTAEEAGLSALGYVVPAKNIASALHNTLAGHQNITIIHSAKLKQLEQHKAHATVDIETTTGNRKLDGTLIIGADGSFSTVRELLNIATETTDYQQSAIVTITELQRSHQHIAYERFLDQGIIAMLPLPGNRTATIWTDRNEVTSELMALDDVAFLQCLQNKFGYRLGRLLRIQKRYTYPLQMIKAQQLIKQHVMLIGNAAHTLSPVAAQGLNLALSEIAMLTQTILDQSHQLAAPNWQNYLTWQQQQQSISTRLSHQLPWLFSQNILPITLLRQVGMIGLDMCLPLKKYFTEKTLGVNKLHD